MVEEEKFTYKIDTKEPLSVDDFSQAIQAINEEYKRYSCNQKELRISEIRKGSFEVEFLSAIIPTLFAAVETSNAVFDFCTHLNNLKDYIIGKANDSKKPNEKSVQNCVQIIRPVFNNYGTINLTNGSSNGNNFTVSNSDAQQVYTSSKQILKDVKPINDAQSQKDIYKKVLFYWYQARFDNKKASIGNKGIIDSIQQNKAVKVIFEDDKSTTKVEMTTSIDGVDWQKRIYIVDIEVMKKDDKILYYKILQNYMEESIVDFTLFDPDTH